MCLYAIGANGGTNTTLGCRTVTVPQPSPFGAVDVLRRVDGGIEIAGWAADPDTTMSIDVHVYVDGVLRTIAHANGERLDVAAARPSTGTSHGYQVLVPASREARQVCVYGINVEGGVNADGKVVQGRHPVNEAAFAIHSANMAGSSRWITAAVSPSQRPVAISRSSGTTVGTRP